MSVLVYVENVGGTFKKSTLEVVSYSKAIADNLKTDLVAISIGDVDEPSLKNLGKYGVSKVLQVTDPRLNYFVTQAYASIISQAVKTTNASVLVLANSFSGKGLAPRISIKLQAGLADGCVELPTITGTQFSIKKTAFSGKAFAYVDITSPIKIITLNPNSYPVKESETAATVEPFAADMNTADFKAAVKETIRATDKISLPEAERVVSAGRGLKGPENWGIIEDLAAVLDAATACSKPVSDADWRPHEEHVGQTGIAISPNLYIAVGISGAIQHLAGVSSSKTIVVINKDPEAPFFKVADYGIVGDAFEIIPKLTAAIKSYKAQN